MAQLIKRGAAGEGLQNPSMILRIYFTSLETVAHSKTEETDVLGFVSFS